MNIMNFFEISMHYFHWQLTKTGRLAESKRPNGKQGKNTVTLRLNIFFVLI